MNILLVGLWIVWSNLDGDVDRYFWRGKVNGKLLFSCKSFLSLLDDIIVILL